MEEEGGEWEGIGEKEGPERIQSKLFAPKLGYLAALLVPENQDSWFWPQKLCALHWCLTALTFKLMLRFPTGSDQNLSSYTALSAAISFPPAKGWTSSLQ